MNSFMNALWNSAGSVVTGKRDGIPFLAYVSDVRVKYGTDLGVAIRYDNESTKDIGYATDILDGSALYNGSDSRFSNLHVYFE